MANKSQTLRAWFPVAVVGLVLVGLAGKFGWGSACALGVDGLAYVCPLGFLQVTLAGRTLYLDALPAVTITLAVIVLFGAAFCSWVCPSNIVDALLRRNGSASHKPALPPAAAHDKSVAAAGTTAPVARRGWLGTLDSRHIVLAGTLVSSAVFGFPVLCLICPVGLFFGTLFALGRLFSIQQAGLELLIFPAILGIEFLVLRKWCRSLCPLGALLSLLSNLNPFFRPAIATSKCIRSGKVNCQVCRTTCPEDIDPREPERARALSNCVKCLRCSDKCPTHAITFPIFKRSHTSPAVAPVGAPDGDGRTIDAKR